MTGSSCRTEHLRTVRSGYNVPGNSRTMPMETGQRSPVVGKGRTSGLPVVLRAVLADDAELHQGSRWPAQWVAGNPSSRLTRLESCGFSASMFDRAMSGEPKFREIARRRISGAPAICCHATGRHDSSIPVKSYMVPGGTRCCRSRLASRRPPIRHGRRTQPSGEIRGRQRIRAWPVSGDAHAPQSARRLEPAARRRVHARAVRSHLARLRP